MGLLLFCFFGGLIAAFGLYLASNAIEDEKRKAAEHKAS